MPKGFTKGKVKKISKKDDEYVMGQVYTALKFLRDADEKIKNVLYKIDDETYENLHSGEYPKIANEIGKLITNYVELIKSGEHEIEGFDSNSYASYFGPLWGQYLTIKYDWMWKIHIAENKTRADVLVSPKDELMIVPFLTLQSIFSGDMDNTLAADFDTHTLINTFGAEPKDYFRINN